jgi:hypothetical protein
VQTITSPTTTITTQPAGVAVRSAVKAGGSFQKHNDGVIVRSNVKAGRLSLNHSEAPVEPAPTTTQPAEDEGLVIEF